MAQGVSHRRFIDGHHGDSSSIVLFVDEDSIVDYHVHTPLQIQLEIDLPKVNVKFHMNFIYN